MNTEQTTDPYDTAELELELAPDSETSDMTDGPTWTPEDGDFS